MTIVILNFEMLFGQIQNQQMYLNQAGEMITRWWYELLHKFPNINADIFVVMPNHLHGIIFIHESASNPDDKSSLIQMMHWFKTMTTNEYIRGVKQWGWKPFDKHLWHRSYYDHIIRSEIAAQRITNYIETNPARWHNDKYHPK